MLKSVKLRLPSIACGIVLAWLLADGPVRAEPPIRSPEDAACRTEARAKVFAAPNPNGLEIEEIGRQIYFACMKRIGGSASEPAGRPRRRHHHRRGRR
jgi:hypothetical protein